MIISSGELIQSDEVEEKLMLLPLEHFSLQLAYALKAVEIAQIPLEQALMEFTQYWVRVNNASFLMINNLAWSFDPNTPDWQELCTRIQNGEIADRVAYDLYKRNHQETDNDNSYFGCFRFDFHPEWHADIGVIELHFHNRDHSGYGPLSKMRQAERTQDLKSMFTSVKQHYPQAKAVHGGSWLYNIEAYKRLFPASFTTHIPVEDIPFPRSSGIWGQFLDSEGGVKPELASTFLSKVNNTKTIDHLHQCFEYKILYPRAKIEGFYNFFALG